jgi:hypothetical protein
MLFSCLATLDQEASRVVFLYSGVPKQHALNCEKPPTGGLGRWGLSEESTMIGEEN